MFRLAVRSWNRLVGRRREPGAALLSHPGAEPDDRRVWVRYCCELEITCQSAHEPAPLRLSAKVQDISLGGINLLVNCQFEPGAMLSVDLPGSHSRSSQVLAYVVRVNREGPGEWSVGCAFASELGDEDLQPFGARRVKAPPPDQRAWVRFQSEARAVYRLVRGDATEDQSAQVLNIAPGGVGLRVPEPVDLGCLLSLGLQNPRGEAVLTIMASVIRITQQEDECVLGCNFIRELSAQEIKALVRPTPHPIDSSHPNG
jgi:hypothetical protein